MRRFILSCGIAAIAVLGSAAPSFAQNCVHATGTFSFTIGQPATFDLTVGGQRVQGRSTRTVLAQYQFGTTTYLLTSHRFELGGRVLVTQDITLVTPTSTPGVSTTEVRLAIVSGASGFLYQQGQVNFLTRLGGGAIVGTICF